MSVQSELDRISEGKTAIVTSIENQGVAVPDGTTIDALSTYVDAINNSNHTHEISQVNGLQTTLDGKLGKTTYEESKELALGSNGKVCLGKFGAYDTNITIELNSTTSTTYHATIVIHSQNVVANGTGGAVGCNVYDDADNHITPLISVFRPYGSASRQIEVYADLPGWSKNLVHVQAVALSTGGMTDVLTSVSAIPTAIDGKIKVTPVNVLTDNFASKAEVADKADQTDVDQLYTIASNLHTVATSGSYNDLSNKPTIPTVNNATLTIQKNGSNVATFTANSASNATANITVPTKTSELTNDSGFITGITVDSALSSTSTNPVQNKVINSALAGKAASSHTHKIDTLSAGYLNTHPENSPTIIPFINNDLGHLLSKGGSCSIYTTTDTSYTANTLTKSTTIANSANLFDGSPSYMIISTTGEFTMVVDLTLHKTFEWSNQFYIDFGAVGWRAKNISVLVKNSSTETAYTLKGSVTNQGKGFWYTSMSHSSTNSSGTTVQGFNCLRIVISGWNNTSSTSGKRISQIGLINYGSAGVTETFVSRGGSTMYGDLNTKNLYPTATNASNLGSSSKQYNTVYGKTIYENGTALSSKYVTITQFEEVLGSTIDEMNALLGG